MAVGLRVRSVAWVVGSPGLLTAFFSSIGHLLEPDGWGSRFPALQNELYRGELKPESVAAARGELVVVQEELARFPPSAVVWDIYDLNARPPWGDDISPDITDLSKYFKNPDGVDIFELFEEPLDYAEREPASLTIDGRL